MISRTNFDRKQAQHTPKTVEGWVREVEVKPLRAALIESDAAHSRCAKELSEALAENTALRAQLAELREVVGRFLTRRR